MQTFPYDPTTGKRLTRSGFSINPISPMTQAEVDRQCELVSEAARIEEEIKPDLMEQGYIDYVPGLMPY